MVNIRYFNYLGFTISKSIVNIDFILVRVVTHVSKEEIGSNIFFGELRIVSV